MSEAEQIKKLKEVAQNALQANVILKTIDALAAYGDPAITALADIAEHSTSSEITEHALDAIKKIKTR